MRKSKYLLFIISILLLDIYVKKKNMPIHLQPYHYKHRIAYFKKLNKGLKPGGIVFLGDSLTEHFITSEFFPEHYVINRGISGDTTDGVLNRLQESVYNVKPEKVFLLIGTNDLGNKKEREYIINNIDRIIINIKEKLPQTKIYLQSLYPIRKEGQNKIRKAVVGVRNNEQINSINQNLISLSKKRDITYIDINSLLQDEDGELKYKYTLEGLHISPLGYEVVAKGLYKYL
ncbi:MAG: GDSL-type esterase/lipase family protein [Vallitalea sp.]|jgi:lysophospholipase L1-like esterase|nr:GDSL-type esterase/lipase family protein [Vallitalea sp.]